MVRLLAVSTSGYYAWRKRAVATEPTPCQQRRVDLAVKILDVHADSDGTYGSPRITSELRERGETVNEKTVGAIMAGIGIEGISPRTFKVRTTVTDPAASFPPDLVRRKFDQGRLDAVWLTDITYLTCGEGDLYLCAIRDGHSRRVLGYVVADHVGADMVCEAIDAAVACRGRSVAGTVLHSDRGGEFTGGLTVKACAAHKLKRSMGDTGICWDNSPAESNVRRWYSPSGSISPCACRNTRSTVPTLISFSRTQRAARSSAWSVGSSSGIQDPGTNGATPVTERNHCPCSVPTIR
jgi:putative transposase